MYSIILGGVMAARSQIWIMRDFANCSGCRLCEVVCSLMHEGRIWPEASRIRVFKLVPGIEFPHLCSQCEDYPCVNVCPVKALSINEVTGAVMVDDKKCIMCGKCIDACPGKVPHKHPSGNYVVICDLCGGHPKCVEICKKAKYNVLWVIPKAGLGKQTKLYARKPKEISDELVIRMYGAFGRRFL